MTLPGTTVTLRDSAPPRTDPTDTGVWFVVGFAEKGPSTPELVTSIDDLVSKYGDRVTYGVIYDAADAFFHEGGSEMYVCRVLGPTPVKATHTFQDAVPANSLIFTAKEFGDYGNNVSVAITHPDGTHYVIAVSYDGTLVETSPSFTTQQQAADWSETSDYVTITLGVGTGIPAVATASLAGGTDDHTSAAEANWLAALNLFTDDLGPGQVSMPGRTTTAAHANLLAHAENNNRVALLDAADTASASTLGSAAATDRAATGARFGGLFAPWAVIPGVTAGTTRTIPYSAIEAGIIARNDAADLNPNEAAAGPKGISSYALGLSQTYSDVDRSTLNDAGVNVAIVKNGQIQAYGYRTLVDGDSDPGWLQLTGTRLVMAIYAEALAIGDRYVFAQIDDNDFTIGDFRDDLVAMMSGWYKARALYGASPAEAFAVDTGSAINTPTTIAAGELRAQITFKASPFAEQVQLFITKKQITEAI